MEQFVPADWSSNVGEAFAPSCGQDDGLVELLRCGGHVVMQSQPPERVAASAMVQDHEAAPWFRYPAVFGEDRSLEKDLFSEIFGEMPAGWDSGGDNATTPLRAGDAVSSHDYASATVAASSIRPKMPGKRKQSDTSESPGEVMQGVEESGGPAHKPQTGKRRRVAQEHNLSERRRRDRINEKMRALQQLVPHCNKADKASMLDEAIEYLKSLQLQVQTMWTTGGGMAPASGAHRYMQRIASTTRSRMLPFRTSVYTSSNGTKY